MRLLWLLKRRYMAKDLIEDRFGRYYHLPRALASHGIRSHVIALDYRLARRIAHEEGGVRWESATLDYPWRLSRARYDVVVAGHDAIYCVLGRALATIARRPLVLDLSDDYEAYASARVPGVVPFYRRSFTAAAGVACVSRVLAEKARRDGAGLVAEMENAVDVTRFHPLPRAARATHVIGYVGAIHPNRGMATLYAAWPRVRARLPGARLVLAGRVHAGAAPPAGIEYLGELAHSRVPDLLRSLDVAIVMTLPNCFGRACDSVKLVEARACGVKTVAARVGRAGELLCDEELFTPGDAYDLAEKIIARLQAPAPTPRATSWEDLAARYAAFLREATRLR